MSVFYVLLFFNFEVHALNKKSGSGRTTRRSRSEKSRRFVKRLNQTMIRQHLSLSCDEENSQGMFESAYSFVWLITAIEYKKLEMYYSASKIHFRIISSVLKAASGNNLPPRHKYR